MRGGGYVWFVDSDDIIQKNCISKICEIIDKYNPDMLTVNIEYFEFTKHFSDLEEKMSVKADLKHIRTKIPSKICCSGPRIIKRELLVKNNIYWDERLTCDDILYVGRVMLYGNVSIYCPYVTYFIRETPNSASRVRSEEMYEKSYRSAKLLIEEYLKDKERGIKLKTTELKIRQASASLLLQGLLSSDAAKPYDAMNFLKEKGLYPYKLIWSRLIFQSCLSNTIVNWISFLFPFEWYYKFAAKYLKFIWRKLR